MPIPARLPDLLPETADGVGRFLPRWKARAIQKGNITVIEFLDNPWYTEPARKRGVRQRLLHRFLRTLRLT